MGRRFSVSKGDVVFSTFIALVVILFIYWGFHMPPKTDYSNTIVRGKIQAITTEEIEPGLKGQVIRWETAKKSKAIRIGESSDFYEGEKWFFVGQIISDSLKGYEIEIVCKTVDTNKGIFLPIAVKEIL